MKAEEIRKLCEARCVLNRLRIDHHALWVDGFLAGLEAAEKEAEESDDTRWILRRNIAEARKAAGK
jgi:hypothetical protein